MIDKVLELVRSDVRPTVDSLLLKGTSAEMIARQVKERHDVDITVSSISKYRQEYWKKGNSPIHDIIEVSADLSKDFPAENDRDRLFQHFTFKSTNDDLDLIYDRIRQLRVLANQEPDKSSYDKRIKDYLSQAEAIRTRVFRHDYDRIRKAVLISVGKKLCMAAISILMPYIRDDKRKEALNRFQSAIEPLLDMKAVPDIPSDMSSDTQ
jgi:hypothetical protein